MRPAATAPAAAAPAPTCRQYAFSGASGNASNYATTYSVSATGTGLSTLTETDAPSFGSGGVITSGSDIETLTSTDAMTQTYSENGSRSISWSTGNEAGSYSDTETTSETDSQYDSSSLSLGTNGTVASGTAISSTTASFTDSQSDQQSGTASDDDPADGPAFYGSYTQVSLTTSMGYSVNGGTQTLGAGGAITGGGNSFTFVQNNSDSHALNVTTNTVVISDGGSDSYSLSMMGTETYGTGGTVSSGSDSFTWAQLGLDNLTMSEQGGGSAGGTYTTYMVSEADNIDNSFSAVGTDILGASDTVRGGCDTYTWVQSRDVNTSVSDGGDSATEFGASGNAWDDFNLTESGSDTLTTDGHIYATITYTYSENSGAADNVSETGGGSPPAWSRTAAAADSYSVSDSGTITISDTVTTSYDSFSVSDSHSISGSMTTTAASSGDSLSWSDQGINNDVVTAAGTKSTSGDNYSFTNLETSNDNFNEYKSITNSISGNDVDTIAATTSISGSTAPNNFTFVTLSQGSSSISESGDTTYGGVVSGINENEALTQTLNLQLTGGPGITTRTIESVTSFTSSGLGGNFTETENMGAGLAAGAYVGDQVGDGAYGSAEHLGTTPNGVDNESGLLSALGGVAMHPIAFAGAEILPAIDSAENGVWLEENNQYGQTPTNWISHPSGIGYRRAAPGVASSSGHAAIPPSSGNQPTMDSGLADGDNDEEVNRLENFDTGGNDNTTSPQAGPTSRADQLAMDFACRAGARRGELCRLPRCDRRRHGRFGIRGLVDLW